MLDFNAVSLNTSVSVFTWGEYKEYCFPLIKAAFGEEATEMSKGFKKSKPKLSLFDGRSFDKMYNDFKKALSSIKNNTVGEKDKKKLLAILNKYKGKRSPGKLAEKNRLVNFITNRPSEISLTVEEVKIALDELGERCYGKEELPWYSFIQELGKHAKSLVDNDVVNRRDLNKIKKIVKKYRKYFNDNQKRLIDSIVIAIDGRIDTLHDYFKKDLRELKGRTIGLYIREVAPHREKSNVLNGFFEQCVRVLNYRFSSREEKQKLVEGEDITDVSGINEAIEGGKIALEKAISGMKQYVNEAKKFAQ